MSSTRETVLQALLAALQTISGPKVVRDEVLPARVPLGGLIIMWDGEPGAPEITLSPLSYYYEHKAEVEVFVQAAKADIRAAAFDYIVSNIAAAIAADNTLGGLCDWAEAAAPKPVDLPVEGGETMKAAIIEITLIYTTADPLA